MPILRVHVHKATGLPRSGSFLSGNSLYCAIRVDDEKVTKSHQVEPSPDAVWNFRAQVNCQPGARQLILEVKRAGLFGKAHQVGGCALPVATLATQGINDSLPLYSADATEIGRISVSIEPAAAPALSYVGGGVPGGLTNYAAGGAPAPAATTAYESQHTLNLHSPVGRGGGVGGGGGGGLVNYASSPSGIGGTGIGNQGGLVNYSTSSPSGAGIAPSLTKQMGSFGRSGTTGLENLASARDDGTKLNAIPRARELLDELNPFRPDEDEHRHKLAQALENLRCAPSTALQGPEGHAICATCSDYISALFECALVRKEERDVSWTLWLAGRLPTIDEDRESLQDILKRSWDAEKMTEALTDANSLLGNATRSADALENLMDKIDLAEFHAHLAGSHVTPQVDALLAKLGPQLRSRCEGRLQAGALDEIENILSTVGAARIETLGLRPLQEQLQRQKGFDLLKSALMPIAGQIGYPELKDRQRRHAVMTVRYSISADSSGAMRGALSRLLLQELLPVCIAHSAESASAALRTALDLRAFSDEAVWAASRAPFDRVSNQEKPRMIAVIKSLCKELGKDPPDWLLTPEQASCQQLMRRSLANRSPEEILAACQKVMETPGAQEVCQEEMKLAVQNLRSSYRLPEAWDVSAMLGGEGERRLLAKTQITDRSIVQHFDRLLKQSANAVWTRDRRGGVPRSFTAVKAVQVLNATNWAQYVHKRDQILAECRRVGARSDHGHWQDNLNGLIVTSELGEHIARLTDQPPLVTEANEAWLLHGSSHTAAEGITTQDFDMTRANPSGLFGAGVYFAESTSKSDEYVEGKVVDGRELFPILVCRVCLGYVYYCDERRPDRRDLEARCLRQGWHSVLGDRKKTSGTFREFIIYDNLQAFPAYIVYYTRDY